jgi:hypothetical protein
MKKFLLIASAVTVVTLLAAPAFAEGPADHGGSDLNAQGSSDGDSRQGNDNDPPHYHHDGNDEERQPNRRTEVVFGGAREQGGASGGKKK